MAVPPELPLSLTKPCYWQSGRYYHPIPKALESTKTKSLNANGHKFLAEVTMQEQTKCIAARSVTEEI